MKQESVYFFRFTFPKSVSTASQLFQRAARSMIGAFPPTHCCSSRHPSSSQLHGLRPWMKAQTPSGTGTDSSGWRNALLKMFEMCCFCKEISFGDIPNSSSIGILMPWRPFCAMVLPMWTMLSAWSKQSHACSCPGCKQQTTPELSGTFWTLASDPTPTRAGTLRNPPEPSQTFRNQPFGTFRNLPPEPTPAYAGTIRNLPEPASGTYTSTRRNSPEPSGTFLRNLLLRPAPAHTGAYLGWRPH